MFKLIPELEACKIFNENDPSHQYNVYKSILNVVDIVPNDLTLRLSALFHDIGKPSTYTEDEQGIGRFNEHWLVSGDIFKGFAKKYDLEESVQNTAQKLITYHHINIDMLNNKELKFITSMFNKEELIMLFKLKKADLLAQTKEYHPALEDYKRQEVKVLKRYERK